jgi:hypothetical protein
MRANLRSEANSASVRAFCETNFVLGICMIPFDLPNELAVSWQLRGGRWKSFLRNEAK